MVTKTEIVHKHLDDHISVRTLEKEYTVDRSMICRWVEEYITEGESAFISKEHPGNPFAALNVSKRLSELERLRLMVAKLEIENERLKKILGGRSWCKQGVRYRTRQEHEIIETLREKCSVVFLCKIMGVSKSGYYRWRGRRGKLDRYEQDRQLLTKPLKAKYKKHPSHGYHMFAKRYLRLPDGYSLTTWHTLGHKYEAIYSPHDLPASFNPSRSIDARGNFLWRTTGEIVSAYCGMVVKIWWNAVLI